jgi:hypothetical protein
MSEPEEIAQQQQLLATHRRTLAHLLLQQAKFSAGHVPAHVANGIAEAREEIQRIKSRLRSLGDDVEDHANDVPHPPTSQLSAVSQAKSFRRLWGVGGALRL